jgi:hypothetical protein
MLVNARIDSLLALLVWGDLAPRMSGLQALSRLPPVVTPCVWLHARLRKASETA